MTFSKPRPFPLSLAALLLASLACSLFLPQPTSTHVPVPSATNAPQSTPTPILTSTPLPSATPTRRSTSTVTPPPSWVAEFAQPVLDAIARRAPDFQDNFDDKSGGWQADRCGGRLKVVDGELILTDCRAVRAQMASPDFVIEFEARFLPETGSPQAVWGLAFRRSDVYGYFLLVDLDGLLWFMQKGEKGETRLDFPQAANPDPKKNQLQVIAKGSQLAVYINGRPLYYLDQAVRRTGENLRLGAWGNSPTDLEHPSVVAFDNFKFWDLSGLVLP